MATEQRNEVNQIDDLKRDLNSLKENVVDLTRRVQDEGHSRTRELSESARQRINKLNDNSRAQMLKMEEQIKDRPGQSIALAFAAGLLTSAIMARRN